MEKQELKVSRIFAYLGLLTMIASSIYVENLLAGAFSFLCLLLYGDGNRKSDRLEKNRRQFESLP